MQRITEKQLENLADWLNELTNSPKEPYSRDESGRLRANAGNFHISYAYGGVNVHRMVNEGGGVTCPISHGYKTKRELFNEMHAFIRGMSV